MKKKKHLAAGKYARALLFLAQDEGVLDEVSRDLDWIATVFSQGEGRDLLLHPLLSQEQKQAAVAELVSGRVSDLSLSFLQLLIEKRRGALVGEIAESFHEELQRVKGLRSATVTAAVPLQAEQMENLRRNLSAIAGAEVELTQVLEPALRGGARITLGDLVLDGSIGARLAKLRKTLLGNGGQQEN